MQLKKVALWGSARVMRNWTFLNCRTSCVHQRPKAPLSPNCYYDNLQPISVRSGYSCMYVCATYMFSAQKNFLNRSHPTLNWHLQSLLISIHHRSKCNMRTTTKRLLAICQKRANYCAAEHTHLCNSQQIEPEWESGPLCLAMNFST